MKAACAAFAFNPEFVYRDRAKARQVCLPRHVAVPAAAAGLLHRRAALPAERARFHLYVILDIFSRYVVGSMMRPAKARTSPSSAPASLELYLPYPKRRS